ISLKRRETAIGMKSFIHDDEISRLFKEIEIIQGKKSADVDKKVFLAAHRASVGVRAHFQQDSCDGMRLETGFPRLDEPRVFYGAGRIEHDFNSIALCKLSDFAYILH